MPSTAAKMYLPPDVEGYVLEAVPDGQYTIEETLLTVQLMDGSEKTLTMTQKWPIRIPRPTAKRFPAVKPLITGQRILDTMFPLAKGVFQLFCLQAPYGRRTDYTGKGCIEAGYPESF